MAGFFVSGRRSFLILILILFFLLFLIQRAILHPAEREIKRKIRIKSKRGRSDRRASLVTFHTNHILLHRPPIQSRTTGNFAIILIGVIEVAAVLFDELLGGQVPHFSRAG